MKTSANSFKHNSKIYTIYGDVFSSDVISKYYANESGNYFIGLNE